MNGMVNGMNNGLAMYNDPAAVAAAESAKARIQSAYIMALNKPRNYDQSRVNIMTACKRPDFAEKVEYSKPVGGTQIVGPSIRLAELALREWGNVYYENQVIYDDDTVRRVRITVIDLQTNATFGKEIQLTKTVERKNGKGREIVGERTNTYGEKVYIVKATEDEIQTREAALISKALRNEGLRLIPNEIIEEAIVTARTTMHDRDKKDPDTGRKKLIDSFAALGIMPTELEKYLKHPVAQCIPSELQDLRKIYTAIREGDARWSDYITPDVEDKQEADDDLKSKLLGNGKQKSASTNKDNVAPVSEAPDFPFDDGPALPELSKAEKEAVRNALSSEEALREKANEMLLVHLGLTENEADEWCLKNFGRKRNELSKKELETTIAKVNAELDARDGVKA